MSQGAGSANGVGLLIDGEGADGYVGENGLMTQGHADWRRERPSLGFFLDWAGKDFYHPIERENRFWHTLNQSRGHGLGRDRNETSNSKP
jgi:hypothetical protein